MKKILLAVLLLVSNVSYAAGPYDGIWSISIGGVVSEYIAFNEDNASNLIAIIVDPDPINGWVALSGQRVGNNIVLRSIAGVDIQLTATVAFNNNGSALATINSCVDGVQYICKFPSGISLSMVKIF